MANAESKRERVPAIMQRLDAGRSGPVAPARNPADLLPGEFLVQDRSRREPAHCIGYRTAQ